jgi:MFS superfamily sulfate permease-like transporter
MDGIAVAVVLSLIDQIRHTYRPRTRLLVRARDGHWIAIAPVPDMHAVPGILVYRFEADLFYANASLFMEEILRLTSVGTERVHGIMLDASGIDEVDYTAAKMLLQVRNELTKRGVAIAVVASDDAIRELLLRYGFCADGGPEFFATVDAAIVALRTPAESPIKAAHAGAATTDTKR